jgi:hypothetical protein
VQYHTATQPMRRWRWPARRETADAAPT